MKATGIVRRIDELGRVVIPKEIRRTYRINVGDPLEIFTDKDGQIIFKKYSPIAGLSNVAGEYVDALRQTTGCNVYVCDQDMVLACSGKKSKDFKDNYISKGLLEKIQAKKEFILDAENIIGIVDREDTSSYVGQLIYPICVENEPVGCIIFVSTERKFGSGDALVAKTTALLMERQIDC